MPLRPLLSSGHAGNFTIRPVAFATTGGRVGLVRPTKKRGIKMNQTEARTLREGHNAYVKRLDRMTKAALAVEYRREMTEQGMTSLFGGPVSKEELIRALCELRYPIAKLNESIHVIAHDVTWPDCPHCQAEGRTA